MQRFIAIPISQVAAPEPRSNRRKKLPLELGLGHLGHLHGLNVLSLLHAQLPAQLVQLLLVMGGHLDVGHEVLV